MRHSYLMNTYSVNRNMDNQNPNSNQAMLFLLLCGCVKDIIKEHNLQNPNAFQALNDMTDTGIQNGRYEQMYVQKYGGNGAMDGCLNECIPDLVELYNKRDHNAYVVYAFALLKADPQKARFVLEKYYYEFDVWVGKDDKYNISSAMVWGALCIFYENVHKIKLDINQYYSKYFRTPENAKKPLIELGMKSYVAAVAAACVMIAYIVALV